MFFSHRVERGRRGRCGPSLSRLVQTRGECHGFRSRGSMMTAASLGTPRTWQDPRKARKTGEATEMLGALCLLVTEIILSFVDYGARGCCPRGWHPEGRTGRTLVPTEVYSWLEF